MTDAASQPASGNGIISVTKLTCSPCRRPCSHAAPQACRLRHQLRKARTLASLSPSEAQPQLFRLGERCWNWRLTCAWPVRRGMAQTVAHWLTTMPCNNTVLASVQFLVSPTCPAPPPAGMELLEHAARAQVNPAFAPPPEKDKVGSR